MRPLFGLPKFCDAWSFCFFSKVCQGKSIFFPVMRSVVSNLAANHSAAVKQGFDKGSLHELRSNIGPTTSQTRKLSKQKALSRAKLSYHKCFTFEILFSPLFGFSTYVTLLPLEQSWRYVDWELALFLSGCKQTQWKKVHDQFSRFLFVVLWFTRRSMSFGISLVVCVCITIRLFSDWSLYAMVWIFEMPLA